MQKKSVNPLSFFVVFYALLLSALALAGYILNYLDLPINALNMFIVILITGTLISLYLPLPIPKVFNKFDLIVLAVLLFSSLRFAAFFISNYPLGNSVDIAHYYFISDWIQNHSNMKFFDYTNSHEYYYLWHTWPLWYWYYGFEFVSVFVSSVFNINILKSMQIMIGMSSVISILCVYLIGSRVLNDWRGGILAMLQFVAMPAAFILANEGFYSNITGLSIGLVLVYLSLDKVKSNHLPVIFVLITGGFLVHIHTTLFILGTIVLYKIISYEKQDVNELFGYFLASGFAFITAFALNPVVFKEFLFGISSYIIIDSGKKGFLSIPFTGFENLFGHSIFLIIGIIGTCILYRNRLRMNKYQIVWFVSFTGVFMFLLLSGKMHWANRMANIVIYPLAISCAALYVNLCENVNNLVKKRICNISKNKITLIFVIILVMISLNLNIDRYDRNAAIYDAGLELRNVDSNATIAYIQYPEPTPNPNKFFISAYSKHRIAWPVANPDNLTYKNIRNISYTNDYIPAWAGGIPEKYNKFENFGPPDFLLIMFASSKNYTYYLFDINQNITCQSILSNSNNDDCSIHMDFINDENLLIKSGFYEQETTPGRWSSGKAEIMIPTIEQKDSVLRIVAGAFRPEDMDSAIVEVYFNDIYIGNFTARNEYSTYMFRIDSQIIAKPFSEVTFITTTWKPDELIGNGDERNIGIKFSSVEFIAN